MQFNIMLRIYVKQFTLVHIAKLIDWCFTARQHKIGQFVPIYLPGGITGSGVWG